MIAFAKAPGTSGVRTPEELLAEFRATGAQAPFEELVRRYAAMVFNECYAVTKSRPDAEDASQATFLTLAVQARTGEEIRHLGPWLQRVARRVALDQEKSKRRRKKREDNHHRVNGTTGVATHHRESLDQLELRHLINEELQQLPAKYRMPLVLHYFGGLTREQMAVELKCKPATLGVRLFRAREMLGKRLAKKGITLSAAALPVLIAAVVRESVENHGVMAMAATGRQIADAAARVAAGLQPHFGTVSSSAMALAEHATQDLVLRKVRGIIAAAAIGASALVAGGATVVHKFGDVSLNLRQIFDVSTYFRSLTAPGLPAPRVDASREFTVPVTDPNRHPPAGWPAALALGGPGSLQLATVSLAPAGEGAVRAASQSPIAPPSMQLPPAAPVEGAVRVAGTNVRELQPAAAPLTRAVVGHGQVGPVASVHGEEASMPSRGEFRPLTRVEGLARAGESAWAANTGGTMFAGPWSTYSGGGGFALRPVLPASVLGVHGDVLASGAPDNRTVALAGSTPASASVSADGNVLRGHGTPKLGGPLDNSGVVIADGGSYDRTLDLSNATAISNSIPNPPDGINGWYAQNGGVLRLPTLTVAAGATSTVTWGDSPDDGRLDLVNALRLNFRNVPTDAALNVTLLAADRAEIPAAPRGMGAVSVWSLSGVGLSYDAVDVTARYALPGDEASTLAGPLSGLGFYYFDGAVWNRAAGAIDPATRTISADNVPPTTMLALFANGELNSDTAFNVVATSATVADTGGEPLVAWTNPYQYESLIGVSPADARLGTTAALALVAGWEHAAEAGQWWGVAPSAAEILEYYSVTGTTPPLGVVRYLEWAAANLPAPAASPVITPASGVPEPAALGLLAACVPLLSRRRRR